MFIYWVKNSIKRPLAFALLLAIFGCSAILLILCFSQPNEDVHIAGLTRRNTSEYNLYIDNDSNRDERKWVYSLVSSDSGHKQVDSIENLLLRIEDLNRIKASISNELRSLERDKTKILEEKSNLVIRNEKLLTQINRSKTQLRQLDLDISSNRRQKFEKSCVSGRISPVIFKPLKSSDFMSLSLKKQDEFRLSNPIASSGRTLDFTLCSLTNDFKFKFTHNLDNFMGISLDKLKIDPIIIQELLSTHQRVTNESQNACLVVDLIHVGDIYQDKTGNNLVIDLSSDLQNYTIDDKFQAGNTIKASSGFKKGSLRHHFDILVPSIWQHPGSIATILGSIPPQSPLERKYLASFFGRKSDVLKANSDQDAKVKVLQAIHRNSADDLFLFIYDCSLETNEQCYESRERFIEMSIFTLIIPDEDYELDANSNDLVYFAISRGSIPVIIGKERTIMLPFDEVIDWRRAAIILPIARLSELHFILRSYNPADIYRMKYQGRHIFENYLATSKQIIDTILSVISLERFNYPPIAIQDLHAETYYQDETFNIDKNCSTNACQEATSDSLNTLFSTEIYGPREKPFKSPVFRRNTSLALNVNYDIWNHPMFSAQYLFPSLPNDPISPSEFKYLSPDQGFRPIGDGLGGSGAEFSRALGGDYPNEQFTIILLTYERKVLLMKTLERLRNLAYLNKIIIVWNGIHQGPTTDMVWPDVGVPIVVVKPSKNSLNNRFLPYDSIETEAIFSMDDDSPLRPDEIVFAFRVWRQSRDRIVGFPGRYHAWDQDQNIWMYNSNHSCELSMVLTGGAFFHKYYSYMYSYFMPASIRSVVDKFMNCEDIAMNFLVAHLTRQPPIKVTSRWTFHCANCISSLSEEDSHFRERHECLNVFASIYGYMPLLNTQHRSDSILFKTRLPIDKQKCFKFV